MNLIHVAFLDLFLLKLYACSSGFYEEYKNQAISKKNIIDDRLVDPGWEIADTRKRAQFRSDMTNKANELFRNSTMDYLKGMRDIAENSSGGVDRTWIDALDTYGITASGSEKRPRRGRWAAYYTVVHALKKGNFGKAEVYAVNEIGNYYHLMTPDLLDLITGGPRNEYPSIYAIMATAWEMYSDTFDETKYGQMLTAFAKVTHDIPDLSAKYNSSYEAETLFKKETITVQKDYIGIIYALFRKKRELKEAHLDILVAAVETDSMDVAHIFLVQYLGEHMHNIETTNARRNSLRGLNLYAKAKNYPMIKMLKALQVPMIIDGTVQIRSNFYAEEDPITRAKILHALRIKSTFGENDYLSKIFEQEGKKHLENFISNETPKKVEAFFLKEESSIQRNMPSHIITAIKHTKPEMLKILLEERVKLPKQSELDEALERVAKMDAALKRATKMKSEMEDLIKLYRPHYDSNGNPIHAVELDDNDSKSRVSHAKMYPKHSFASSNSSSSGIFGTARSFKNSIIRFFRKLFGFTDTFVNESVIIVLNNLNREECHDTISMINRANRRFWIF